MITRKSIFLLQLVLISLLVSIAYKQATENGIGYDAKYIFGNPYIENFSVENILWMLTSNYASNWHPLTWFSFLIDSYIYRGVDIAGMHQTNIVLHILNSWLVFVLYLTLFGFNESGDRNILGASITSVLFAVHPQHVESVAWIVERKDVLSMFFMLLTFILYAQFKTLNSYKSYCRPMYVLALIFYSMALMSKPMAVTMPVLLIIVDIFLLDKSGCLSQSWKGLSGFYSVYLANKVPFFILSIIVSLFTIYAQQHAMVSFGELSILDRIASASYAVFFYLYKMLIPYDLSPLYPHVMIKSDGVNIYYLYILLFFIVTSALLVLYMKKERRLLIVWVFYLVALSPVIGIVQVGLQFAADRYAYLPTLPFYMLAGYAFNNIYNSYRVYSLVSMLVVVLVFMHLTYAQVKIWYNSYTLWAHAFSLYPDSGYIQANLASSYYREGDYRKAASLYDQSSERGELPMEWLPYYAIAKMAAGDYLQAINLNFSIFIYDYDYSRVIENDCVMFNIAFGYYKLGQYEKAVSIADLISRDSRVYKTYLRNDGFFGYDGNDMRIENLDPPENYLCFPIRASAS